jgi:hypothetical protein
VADTVKRFSGPTALTVSAVTQYTAPAAGSVLTWVHAVNESGAAQTFRVSLGTDGAGKRIVHDVSVPVGGMVGLPVWIPLTSGEVLQALASAGTAITLVLAGVEQ